MQSLNKDTLAYQFGVRPSTRPRDMSDVPLTSVIGQLNKYMQGHHTGVLVQQNGVDKLVGESERDAIIFYLMNHACSIVRQKVHPLEPLGEYLPVVEEYQRQLSQRAARMFYYMLLICTRESRHSKTAYTAPVWTKFAKDYGQSIVEFHQTIKGVGSSTAADRLRSHPPPVSLGNYVKFLSDVFYKTTYSPSYGGPAWGKVADVLRDYVLGKLTAEMMLDTSFTLAHNTGPIFNKGMLFNQQNNTELIRILDVQRSGQIPQMVANKETKWATDTQVQEVYQLCKNVLGEPMEGYVDWFLVEKLGAVSTYSQEKKAQQVKHGMPSDLKAKEDALQAKMVANAKAKADMEALMIEIMPGLKVKKTEVRK